MQTAKKILTIDTETTGALGSQVAYDIGFTITDTNDTLYASHSLLVKEIFADPRAMATAHYASKYPGYLESIAKGESVLLPYGDILNILNEEIREYQPEILAAYNLGFDKTTMANTTRKFFGFDTWTDHEMEDFDIWNAACHAIFDEAYPDIARAKGWVTEKDNIKTSAEHAYRYLKGIDDFEEAHTGLADCLIENEIMLAIMNGNKPYDASLKHFPCRRVFEYDRAKKITNLELKEGEIIDIQKQIKSLQSKLSYRRKVVKEGWEKLGYKEGE